MTTRTKRIWLIAGGAAILLVLLAGFLVWWFILRDDSPPPPDLESQAAVIAEEQDLDDPTSGVETTPTAAPTSDAADASATEEPADLSGELSGVWVVDNSLGSFEDFTSSYAGYRVTEELASIGANDAVGRTPQVSGQIEIDGTTISAAEIVVDMASLESDSGGRDGRVRSTLEVETFPTASFVLTTPIVFSDVPAEGEAIQIEASGDFTAHGVTRPVTAALEASLVGDVIVVVGSLEISFDDYDVTAPTAAVVLSIDDKATVEWQLNLTRQP